MYDRPYNPYLSNVALVKGYFKSNRVLVMGILYVVSLALSICSSVYNILHPNTLIDQFSRFMEMIDPSYVSDMRELYFQYVSNNSGSAILSMVAGALVTGLFIAAYLIIYAKSRSRSPEATPQAGVTILKVFAIISLVLVIVMAVLPLTAGMILLFVFKDFLLHELSQVLPPEYYNDIASMATVVLVILSVIAALVILYLLLMSIGRVRYYDSVKQSLTTVELQSGGAKLYGVMCIITAVLTVFGVIGNIGSMISATDSFLPSAILQLVSTLTAMAMLIVEGSLALGYHKYIEGYKYGYDEPFDDGMREPDYLPPANNGMNPYLPQDRPFSDDYAVNNAPRHFEDAPAEDEPSEYNDNFGSFTEDKIGPTSDRLCPVCGHLVGKSPFCGNCGAKL